jgi:DNA-binding MurR/RpiR family transcriptional regulator
VAIYLQDNPFTIINEKYQLFSKTFKAIADFITVNYSVVSFLSVQELSERIGVSTASIVRFCQEIGYSGYQAFQHDIQVLVQGESASMLEVRTSISDVDEDPLREMFKLNIETLENSYTEALATDFQKVVEAVNSARRVYIIGLRSTYTVAYYTSFMLSQFMDNVVLLSAATNDLFDHLTPAGPEDVLLAFSFSKYTRLTLQAVEFMRERGGTIIAVTDRQSAPIAIQAGITLIAKNSTKTFSFVSAMTIVNALVIALGKKDAEQTLRCLKEKEEINNKAGVYLSGKDYHG